MSTSSQPRRSRRRSEPRRAVMVLLGLAGVLVALALVVIGFNAPNSIPGRSYYTVRAQFHDADNLAAHYQVRIGGELVGQVLRPRLEHGLATVDLQLKPSVGPLRADTRAVVRPRSAIGVRYLDLIPGRTGRPLHDGDLIPATQTSATVSLDDALSTLDAARRRRAQEFLTALGAGAAGRGDGLSAGLAQTDGLAADARSTLHEINARKGAFGRLIVAARDVAVAAEPVREQLAQLPGGAADALRPLGDQAGAVRRTLAVAPSTLSAVDSGLGRTDTLLGGVRRLTVRLSPALDAAPATLKEATTLLRTSHDGVRRLRGTLVRVDGAVPSTVTLLGDVRRVVPQLDTAMAGLDPLLAELGPRGCDVKRMLFNWQDMLDGGVPIKDKVLGGWLNTLRLTAIVSPESVGGAGPALANLANAHRNVYPAPCEAGTEGRR